LHNANEKKNCNDGNDVEFAVEHQQRKNRPHARGGQRSQNSDGMDKALVQDSQNDVNRKQRGEDQHWLGRKRRQKSLCCSCELLSQGRRCSDTLLHLVDQHSRLSERGTTRKVERNGHRGEEGRVIYSQRRRSSMRLCEGLQRYRSLTGSMNKGWAEGDGIAEELGRSFTPHVVRVRGGDN